MDEGTGKTYGYHGYWARDWTAVDPALGTREDLRAMVDAAHRHGIRVLMDAVINHPGPVTPADPAWPADWVRTSPQCTYRTYPTTTDCTLVPTLPDLRTDSDAPVALPPALTDKWKSEGRLEREVAEQVLVRAIASGQEDIAEAESEKFRDRGGKDVHAFLVGGA